MQKCYPFWMRGRVKEKHKAKFVIVVFFSLSLLHYKLNFPFHCAILNTKVQQLRK